MTNDVNYKKDRKIEVDIELTRELIRKTYYDRIIINLLLKKQLVFVMVICFVFGFILAKADTTYILLVFLYLLGCVLFVLLRGKYVVKRTEKFLRYSESRFKVEISDEMIQIIGNDGNILNKIPYEAIDAVYESKELIIIMYYEKIGCLAIFKNLMVEEEITLLKEFMLMYVNRKKIYFSK